MKTLLVATILAWACGSALARSETVTDQNASLKFTIDEPTANLNVPSDPVQLPRTVEWTVDGRRILVYPSSPLTFLDIGHLDELDLAHHERRVDLTRKPAGLANAPDRTPLARTNPSTSCVPSRTGGARSSARATRPP